MILDLIKDVDTLAAVQKAVSALKEDKARKHEIDSDRFIIRASKYNRSFTGKRVVRIEVEEP